MSASSPLNLPHLSQIIPAIYFTIKLPLQSIHHQILSAIYPPANSFNNPPLSNYPSNPSNIKLSQQCTVHDVTMVTVIVMERKLHLNLQLVCQQYMEVHIQRSLNISDICDTAG